MISHLAARISLAMAALIACSTALPAADAIRNAATGTPKIKSIDAVRFGPEGLLLIGDASHGPGLDGRPRSHRRGGE